MSMSCIMRGIGIRVWGPTFQTLNSTELRMSWPCCRPPGSGRPQPSLTADMIAAREDEELRERAAVERRSVPHTIDAFRCVPCVHQILMLIFAK